MSNTNLTPTSIRDVNDISDRALVAWAEGHAPEEAASAKTVWSEIHVANAASNGSSGHDQPVGNGWDVMNDSLDTILDRIRTQRNKDLEHKAWEKSRRPAPLGIVLGASSDASSAA